MNDRSGFSGTDVLLAALGGAAVGATIALLTAPRTGRETREKLSEYASTGRDKAKHLPGAVRAASTAARGAFVEAMRDEA